MTTVLWHALLALAFLLPACASRTPAPYRPLAELDRDPLRAERLAADAGKILTSNPEKAESLLQDALTADLYCGPAHNNLGVLYLNQGRLYEAAGEFEWARKLLPGHPDPRMNLAYTLELAGKDDEALSTYAAALDLQPGHVATLQAITRLQIKSNKPDEKTTQRLQTIALQGDTPEWRDWARLELAKSREPK
jgi:Flp pilus assembly protein TadD